MLNLIFIDDSNYSTYIKIETSNPMLQYNLAYLVLYKADKNFFNFTNKRHTIKINVIDTHTETLT